MTGRSLLLVGTLAFSGLAMAKSYGVSFPEPITAGSVQLAPGDYSLKLEGDNAAFTDTHGKSFTVPAKIENQEKKAESTEYDTSKQSGTDRLTWIVLGGSKTKLEFGQ